MVSLQPTTTISIEAAMNRRRHSLHELPMLSSLPVVIIDIIASYSRGPHIVIFGGERSRQIDYVFIGDPFASSSSSSHWCRLPTPHRRGPKSDVWGLSAALFRNEYIMVLGNQPSHHVSVSIDE
jgi:hypothetical protein